MYCAAGWRGRAAVWRLADRRASAVHSVVLVANGVLTVDRSFALDRDIYRGWFEVQELDLVASLILPGDSCVDVGANVGLYSVLFAARCTHGTVLAFEPSPTFARLEANLSRYPNATAFNIALGAADETLRLHRADGDHHANLREGGGETDTEVPVRRLDDIPEVRALETVDFLKVDAEGWETQVMTGASSLWQGQRVGIALIEANPAWGPVDYLDTIAGLGYHLYDLRLKRAALGLRHVLDLNPLDRANLRSQANVLAVRPDRLDRLEPWVR